MGTGVYKKWQKVLIWMLIMSFFSGTMGVATVAATVQTQKITIDFEDGTGGFTGRGAAKAVITDENAYSGKCLSVSGGTESWNGAQKNLADLVSGNDILRVSAYVRNNEEYEITVHMTLQEKKSNGTIDYKWIQGNVVIAPGEWKKLSGVVVVDQDTTEPVLYFETKEVGVSFNIDQIEMTIETEEREEDPYFDVSYSKGKIIDFEDGEIYFDKIGNPRLSITRNEGYQGSKGLLVSGRLESYEGPLKDVTAFLENGVSLADAAVSGAALIKNQSEEKRRIAITLRMTKADGTQEYKTLAWAVAEADSWVQLTSQSPCLIGQDVTEAVIYIEAEGTDPFVVDCVNLVAEKAELVEPTEEVEPFERLMIDFEDGQPWFSNRGEAKGIIVSDAFEGEKALAVMGRTQNWHGVEKDLSRAGLEGKGLQTSFWVKNTSGCIVEIYLTLQETDAEGNITYTRIAGGETLPGNWLNISGSVNIQPQTVQAIIYFEASDPTASFVIDNVMLHKVQWINNPESQDGGNVGTETGINMAVKKGSVLPFFSMMIDFEDGEPFFESRGEGRGVITNQAHNGSKALAVKGRTLSWHGIERDFTEAELQGKYLHVSFWTKHNNNEPQDIRFCIQEEDADGKITYNWIAAGFGIGKGEWTKVTGEYLVGADTRKEILYFEATDPELSFLIDDVELKADYQSAEATDQEKNLSETEPVWRKNLGQIYIETIGKTPWKWITLVLFTGIISGAGIYIQKRRKKERAEVEDKNI